MATECNWRPGLITSTRRIHLLFLFPRVAVPLPKAKAVEMTPSNKTMTAAFGGQKRPETWQLRPSRPIFSVGSHLFSNKMNKANDLVTRWFVAQGLGCTILNIISRIFICGTRSIQKQDNSSYCMHSVLGQFPPLVHCHLAPIHPLLWDIIRQNTCFVYQSRLLCPQQFPIQWL